MLALAAIATFNSCSSSDDSSNNGEPTGQKDGLISSQTDEDLDPAALKGDVVANVTLTSDQTWILTGPLSVKDGFTLTIEPGTSILAQAGGTNVYVVVEQGAKINAAGTASAPITFTSNAANPRSGDWGGILINGYAKISGGGTATTEVLPLAYGGNDDSDNSGVMSHVVIEYTGARINGEKEFNGLTLYAVGSQTQLNNIAIKEGDDDGIEFFGGTVSVENLLVIDSRDDLFDFTQGWRGTANSNWYGVRTLGFTSISEDTRGIEGDGNLDGNSPSDEGQSNPTINNVTILNNGIIEFADLVKVRRGASATITNLYLGFNQDNNEDAAPSASDTIDLTDSKGDALASTSITGVVNATSGVDIEDIKNESGALVTLTDGSTPSVDKNMFSWTGLSF